MPLVQSVGHCITINIKSLSGATIISCFFDRIRKNVKSFDGSKSRTTLRAFVDSKLIKPAYWIVVALSKVDRIGIPIIKLINKYNKI